MSLEARRNVIVSHGGRHGVGGTYLAGRAIPDALAPFMPPDIVGLAPSSGPPAPIPVSESSPEAPASSATPAVAVSAVVARVKLPTLKEVYAMGKDDLASLAAELGVKVEGEQSVKALRDALKTAMGM